MRLPLALLVFALAFSNSFAEEPKPLELPAVSVDIDSTAAGTPISPFIYGIAQADPKLALEMGVTIRRLGGNPCTPYNWKGGFTGHAACSSYLLYHGMRI